MTAFFKTHPTAPRRGWIFQGVDDHGPDRRGWTTCDVCGAGLRYAHELRHPSYSAPVQVGCECAASLEGVPQHIVDKRDRMARTAVARRSSFCDLPNWRPSGASWRLRYLGDLYLISQGKFGQWRASYKPNRDASESQWVSVPGWHRTLEAAKLSAHDHRQIHRASMEVV